MSSTTTRVVAMNLPVVKCLNSRSIRKLTIFDYSDNKLKDHRAGHHTCGGALLTELFGLTIAGCMFTDSFHTVFESRAGEHDITDKDGKEQL